MIIVVTWVLLVLFVSISASDRSLILGYRYGHSIILLVSFIVIGFRPFTVGTDTLVYIRTFNNISSLTGNQIAAYKDPIFLYTTKLLALIGLTPRLILLTYTFVIVYALKSFVRTFEVKRLVFFYTVIFALGYFNFAMSGLRQSLAIGLWLLFISEQKRGRYGKIGEVLLLLVAVGFHGSAIIPILSMGFIWFVPRIVLVVIGIFSIFLVPLIQMLLLNNSLLFSLLYERGISYDSSIGQGYYTYFIFFTFFLVILFFSNGKNKWILGIASVACVFQSLVPIYPEFFRLNYYFIPILAAGIGALNNRVFRVVRLREVYTVLFLVMYFLVTIDDAGILPYKY